MRHTIETAPRDGSVIILEDDAKGTYDVAHWSPEAAQWVGENGEPVKITPSHWHPMPSDNHLQQDDDLSSNPSDVRSSASRGRRSGFLFSARRRARRRPIPGDVTEPRSVAPAAPATGTAAGVQTTRTTRSPH